MSQSRNSTDWIYDVPPGWEVKPICRIATADDDSLGEDFNGLEEFRYVDISAVDHVSGIAGANRTLASEAPSRARRLAQKGDVVVSTVRTYLKAVAEVTEEFADCVYSTGFAVLRANRSALDDGYLKWALLNENLIQAIESHSEGLSYPAINTSELVKLKLVVPPIHLQAKISSHLNRATTRIDALVAKKTRFIELLREKRQALITHAVTKGLDRGAAMKDSGVEWLGVVPAHWDVVRGSAVFVECKAKNDQLVSENYLSLMANIGIIPYEEKGDVGNKKPEDVRKCKLVDPGDFVLNSMNYAIGSYGVSSYSGVCSPVYVVMKHRPEVADPKFLDLILSNPSYQNYAQSFGTGILDHRRAIGWDEIKVIRVPLPPLDEQAEIAAWTISRRDRVDTLIAKTERSIELLREHRTALITAAVTGKIDLSS